jgi:hypothetical protein
LSVYTRINGIPLRTHSKVWLFLNQPITCVLSTEQQVRQQTLGGDRTIPIARFSAKRLVHGRGLLV